MALSSIYRTHTCGQLTAAQAKAKVKLSGWVARKRDHGNLLFVDLRDHYGRTQLVTSEGDKWHEALSKVRLESVVMVEGEVVLRAPETANNKLPTGEIEVRVTGYELLSEAETLPIQVETTEDQSEELRFKYRFLDLRRQFLHDRIMLRTKVIASIRKRMVDLGFNEYQTPILTSSSPEGARDFLVPSRLHPGRFYALPQAPQQFKQLIMIAGFDRYFQIAPCFRDEDARADRTAGEFYQLDLEMSFVTQDDVLEAVGTVLHGLFDEFKDGKAITPYKEIRRIPYKEAMLVYGSDKPDLRNPLVVSDATEIFRGSTFGVFANAINEGAQVRAIPAPKAADKPRSWYDKMGEWAKHNRMSGLGYLVYEQDGTFKGPIAKNLDGERVKKLAELANLSPGDALFFVCASPKNWGLDKSAGYVRNKVAQELDLIEANAFRMCWVVDFPKYEFNEETGSVDFHHNPFSMPQGGLQSLNEKDPLDIIAYQYDFVVNGIEIASGGIRNNKPEIMYRAFEIAGYSRETVDGKFGGMISAFRFGAPPHGGCAPGIDRIVMLLGDEDQVRNIVMFPMTQKAEDLMMQAPREATEKQLKELHIRVVMPPAPGAKKE